MPTYDSAATYDSGLRYDQTSPNSRRPMAQIKLDFKGKTPEELVNIFTEIINAMTGNPAFPTPNPTLAVLIATRDLLLTRINDVKAKENAWRAAIAARDTQEDVSVDLFTLLSSYVQNASGGDEVKILSSGYQVRSTATSSSPLTAPQDLRATSGDNEGEIDLTWDRVRNASSYEVQCREQGAPEWQPVKTVTQSRLTIENLTPGKTYTFRVRAIGAQGAGPWSDEAVKRAV